MRVAVKAAAQDVLERAGEAEASPASSMPHSGGAKRGRPKGSKNRVSAKSKKKEDPEVEVPKELLDGAWQILAKYGWEFGVTRFGNRSLTDEEAKALGSAFSLVLEKYFPGAMVWSPELNLALVGLSLYMATLPKGILDNGANEKSPPRKAEEFYSNDIGAEGVGEVNASAEDITGT